MFRHILKSSRFTRTAITARAGSSSGDLISPIVHKRGYNFQRRYKKKEEEEAKILWEQRRSEEEEWNQHQARTFGLAGLALASTLAIAALTSLFDFGNAEDGEEEESTQIREPEGKEGDGEEAAKVAKNEEKSANTEDSLGGEKEESFPHFDFLIVGSGPAAYGAVLAIKQKKPDAEIFIVTEDTNSYIPYERPPLSKELWDEEDEENIANLSFTANGKTIPISLPTGKYFDENVNIMRGTSVVAISATENLAKLSDDSVVSYGKCLIATGASPKKLPISIPDTSRIQTFRTTEDFQLLESRARAEEVSTIAVIGGGLLGTELAFGLAKKAKKNGKKVTQIIGDSVGPLSKYLPSYLSERIQNALLKDGVEIVSGKLPSSIEETEAGRLAIRFDGGAEVEADHIVVAIGAQPNSQLALESHLEVDENNGGIVVNSEMMLRTDLYCAGEVASFWDPILKRKRIDHHIFSYESGKVAGENMAGGKKPLFTYPTFWSNLGSDAFNAVGTIDSSLETVGVFQKGPSEEKEGEFQSVSDAFEEEKNYNSGVVYYLNEEKSVVGVLMWNLDDRMKAAEMALRLDRKFDDVLEDVTRAVPFYEKEEKELEKE